MGLAVSLAGLALIGGAVILGIAMWRIAARPVVGQAIEPGVAGLLLVGAALLLLATPALYAVQADATGAAGVAAHGLLSAGLLLFVIVAATPLLYPSVGVSTIEHPIVFGLGIALALGLLLTGIVTLQAAVLPVPAAAILLAAMAGFAFVFFVAEFLPPIAGQIGTAVCGSLLAAALAWFGVALVQRG